MTNKHRGDCTDRVAAGRQRRWSGLRALALAASLTAAGAPATGRAQEAPVRVSIAAQPLDHALAQLGEQAGLQIFYLPEIVRGLMAPPLSGSMTPDEALQGLLAGSGLTYGRNGRNVSLSRPAATTSQTTQLETVTVRGVQDSATEGTGAYTATGPSSMSSGLGLSLRETPQSISVMTDQRMKDQNLTQLTDVANQTAGLIVNQGGNVGSDSSSIYSRGFAVDTYMVDGVKLVSSYSSIFQSQDMALYDRVEVVRGATGLMNGIGSPGGAINMVRKRPFADFRTEVTLEGGSWGYRRGLFDVSSPLNTEGTVRGRMVVLAQDADSYIDRFSDKRKVFYGVIEADVGDNTQLRAGVSHQRLDLSGSSRGGMPAYAADGGRLEWSRSDSAAASWAYSRRHATSIFVEADHRFANDWQLKASLSRTTTHSDEVIGYLGGTPDRLTGAGANIWATRWEYKPKQDVANLTATGTFTLFGREHDAAMGLNFSRVDYTSPSYSDWTHAGWNGNIANVFVWDGNVPVQPANPSIGTHGTDERNNGAYASVRLRPTDELSVILGSRYLDWRRNTSSYRYVNGAVTESRRTEHEIVPYAGVTYDLNDNWTAYASYTKIFTPQNYKTISGGYIDPLSGDSYETGVKGEFLDGRLNIGAALYEVKENNKAIAIPNTYAPDGSPAYEAKSGTRTRGFEVEVAGMMMRGWELAASYAFNRTVDSEGLRINTGVPKSVAKLYSTYRLDGVVDGLTVGGGLRWQSQIYNDKQGPKQDQRFTQSAYFVVDLLARYEINKNFSASLNVHNLFDKYYYTNAGNSYYGAPRSFKLSLTGTF